MSTALPAVLTWASPPLVGALLGFATARAAAWLAMRRMTVEGVVRSLVATPRVLHEVRQSIARAVNAALALSMSELLSRSKAKTFLVDHLLPILAKDETRKAVALAASAAVHERKEPLISDDLLEAMSGPLGGQLPVVIERLIEWMESAQMRETMAERGRELLPQILEKLNVMQRFLLSAGQFDKRLDEMMPEIVEETLQALERIMRDPTQQHAMRDRILLAIRDWRDGETSRTDTSFLTTRLVDAYLKGLEEPGTRDAIYGALEAFLTRGGLSLGGFLRHYAGVNDADVSDSLANFVLARLLPLPARAAEAAERILEPARARLQRTAGLFGLALGLLIGFYENALRLFGLD